MPKSFKIPVIDAIYGGVGGWMVDNMALEAMETPLANIFAATSQMGAGRLISL